MTLGLLLLVVSSLVFAGNYVSIKDITQIDVKPERCQLLKAYTSKPLFALKKIRNTVLVKLKKPVGQDVDLGVVPKFLDISFITTCGTETRLFPVRDLPANIVTLHLSKINIPKHKLRPLEEEIADMLRCYLTDCKAYTVVNGKVFGDSLEMEEVLYENTGKDKEVLTEAMFCDENCIAVALEKHLVNPGEVVKVWIFRRR